MTETNSNQPTGLPASPRFIGLLLLLPRSTLGMLKRDALAKSKKVAIGQLIMHGREHLVGITAHKKGLVLVILRYADELREPESFFEKLDAEPKKSMQAKGQMKVKDSVRKRMGKPAPKRVVTSSRSRSTPRRTAH